MERVDAIEEPLAGANVLIRITQAQLNERPLLG
jgi:hypothetical protein